ARSDPCGGRPESANLATKGRPYRDHRRSGTGNGPSIAGVRIPARSGQPFRSDLGSHSDGTWAAVPVTWAAIPTTWASVPTAPGRIGGASG
ncbi:MAG TPA: hypothetical protein VGC34_06835, partial [Steroidobacteraceae bacterium]